MAKPLALELIRTDGGTQMRAELNRDVYLDYRDKFLAGVKFPPIDVFHDGSTYWLADGFHRFYGAREAKRGSIEANVHNGTVRDAILHAVGANRSHGLRRTHADKRNCVTALLNDDEWVKFSDAKLAELAGVHHELVGTVRRELAETASSPAAKVKDQPRIGRDGKKRRKPKPKSKPRPIRVIEDDEGDEEWKADGPSVKLAPVGKLIDGHKREDAAKPQRSVFVQLRSLFDSMSPDERQSALVMWQDWME